VTEANTVKDTLTFYDGSTTLGAAPTLGDATTVRDIDRYTDGSPIYVDATASGYDDYGRETRRSVPAVVAGTPTTATTTTTYTPAAGGQPTSVKVTPPMGDAWASTTTYDPARGLPLQTVDANGKATDQIYDPLGRLAAV
jgi:YD repeat-containing protein